MGAQNADDDNMDVKNIVKINMVVLRIQVTLGNDNDNELKRGK